jgi:hypothetical protein
MIAIGVKGDDRVLRNISVGMWHVEENMKREMSNKSSN